MICMHCGSNRILEISGKCSDLFSASYMDKQYGPDYVNTPDNVFGSSDYVEVTICLECGRPQVELPIPDPEWYTEMVEDEEEEDEEEEDDEDDDLFEEFARIIINQTSNRGDEK